MVIFHSYVSLPEGMSRNKHGGLMNSFAHHSYPSWAKSTMEIDAGNNPQYGDVKWDFFLHIILIHVLHAASLPTSWSIYYTIHVSFGWCVQTIFWGFAQIFGVWYIYIYIDGYSILQDQFTELIIFRSRGDATFHCWFFDLPRISWRESRGKITSKLRAKTIVWCELSCKRIHWYHWYPLHFVGEVPFLDGLNLIVVGFAFPFFLT